MLPFAGGHRASDAVPGSRVTAPRLLSSSARGCGAACRGSRRCAAPFLDDHVPVHHQPRDAVRQLMRPREIRAVDDSDGIEDDETLRLTTMGLGHGAIHESALSRTPEYAGVE